jgi:hypothetical protein
LTGPQVAVIIAALTRVKLKIGQIMGTLQIQSLEDVYSVQIEHLRSQHSHLRFMHEYHSWMRKELTEPALSDLHATIVDRVNEALKQLDQLIEILQLAALSDTEKLTFTSD